jgi:mono/diheme cytochrome c family protein
MCAGIATAAVTFQLVACGSAGTREPAPFERPMLCERLGNDLVRDVFCANPTPKVTGLADLQQRLHILPAPTDRASLAATGTVAVLLAHSTSLSGHVVSPINPRLIVPGSNAGAGVTLAFQRGVQRVEMATPGRDDGLLNFYLVTFRQACNARAGGCTPGDLYTPRIESDWTDVDIQDDEDLKNKPSDCRQCHQRGRSVPGLLMREKVGPWMHFFGSIDLVPGPPGATGTDLVLDYQRAKGEESYGSIPAATISHSIAFTLEQLVDGLDRTMQPLAFDSSGIVTERYPYGPDGYAKTPQRSATWDSEYAAFKRGEHLALPYFDERITDMNKQAALSDAYQRYLAGSLAADDLPDFADIFPDDPQQRAEIGLQVEPHATPVEALIQACGACHNDVLDQSVSRARFNIALATMDSAEIALAITRLNLDRSAPLAMPPVEARQLGSDERDRLLHYLSDGQFPASDAAELARAAALGMAGNVKRF